MIMFEYKRKHEMEIAKKYLKNPCKTLSIPLWKHQSMVFSSNLLILHESDVNHDVIKDMQVNRYFRLIHHLNQTSEVDMRIEHIDFSQDIDKLKEMINLSYAHEGIKVSKEDILSYMKKDVFNPSLWVKIEIDNQMIASGIAEFDQNIKEGIIEWVQVLPNYQKKGYGQMIVNALLNRLSKIANFVTVSGHMENLKDPMKLYLRCGFTGNDIWYICKKKY